MQFIGWAIVIITGGVIFVITFPFLWWLWLFIVGAVFIWLGRVAKDAKEIDALVEKHKKEQQEAEKDTATEKSVTRHERKHSN
ncbi:MAG: hypothetical protein KBC74_00595 [Candidatus Pacebacteria bacterium]|nr:hypothetical protein [Candidatus Paceibacterota bacterium]MBP9832012.1 hypothetical protein [Candidatus Paceibacterota bacterium]